MRQTYYTHKKKKKIHNVRCALRRGAIGNWVWLWSWNWQPFGDYEMWIRIYMMLGRMLLGEWLDVIWEEIKWQHSLTNKAIQYKNSEVTSFKFNYLYCSPPLVHCLDRNLWQRAEVHIPLLTQQSFHIWCSQYTYFRDTIQLLPYAGDRRTSPWFHGTLHGRLQTQSFRCSIGCPTQMVPSLQQNSVQPHPDHRAWTKRTQLSRALHMEIELHKTSIN